MEMDPQRPRVKPWRERGLREGESERESLGSAENRVEWMDEVKRQKAEMAGRCGPGAMLMLR